MTGLTIIIIFIVLVVMVFTFLAFRDPIIRWQIKVLLPGKHLSRNAPKGRKRGPRTPKQLATDQQVK